MEYLYETHLHTSEVSACAVSGAAEQVRAYKDRGYTGIIVTDHFVNGNSGCPRNAPWGEKMKYFLSGYEKAKAEGGKRGLDVFFGLEFTVRGSDFLTYGLEPEFLTAHPDMDRLTAEDYSSLVRRHGGYLAQAHQYRDDWYIEHKFPVDHRLVDGIEVYNAGMPDETNAKALAFARLHSLPMQAGSDSHNINAVFTSGIILEKRAESIHDIIAAIKTNRVTLISGKAG